MDVHLNAFIKTQSENQSINQSRFFSVAQIETITEMIQGQQKYQHM